MKKPGRGMVSKVFEPMFKYKKYHNMLRDFTLLTYKMQVKKEP